MVHWEGLSINTHGINNKALFNTVSLKKARAGRSEFKPHSMGSDMPGGSFRNMRIYIKHMVSLRCKMLVRQELKILGLHAVVLELGMVELLENINGEQLEQLKNRLHQSGLDIIDDKHSKLVDRIKQVLIEMIHYAEELPEENMSDFISNKLGYDYNFLANIFSEIKGITIQKFVIMHKIEKVKEMLLYDDFTLTEIAHKLQYSSVAHLSGQFKKVTGLTPTFFKHLSVKRREHRKQASLT